MKELSTTGWLVFILMFVAAVLILPDGRPEPHAYWGGFLIGFAPVAARWANYFFPEDKE